MYKRFIRWASDRLEDDGVIGFISDRNLGLASLAPGPTSIT